MIHLGSQFVEGLQLRPNKAGKLDLPAATARHPQEGVQGKVTLLEQG